MTEDLPLPTVRFKFMPTPSGRLHIGHAWLLFVMQTLIDNLQRHGRPAELVLALDDINMSRGGVLPDGAREVGEGIVCDMEQLGISPARIVRNDEASYAETLLAVPIEAMVVERWQPSLGLPAQYMLHNAALDSRLGITHIVRGEELRQYKDAYEECYDKLGVPTPALDYIPFLCQPDGGKIGSHNPAYTLENVLSRMSVDALFCLLVDRCILREEGTTSPRDRDEAAKRLLGDRPWATTANAWNETGRAEFFCRFVASPCIATELLA